MYIKRLHISNFRCFADYTIEFAPRVTVLFGKNGSGKSTLIHALRKALSFLMYSEEVKEKKAMGKMPKVLDIKTFRLKNPYPARYENFSVDDFKDYEYAVKENATINIQTSADFGNAEEGGVSIEWDMAGSAPKFSVKQSGFKPAFMTLYEWYEHRTVKPQLPLLAYYSDGFPHNTALNQSKSTEKDKRSYHLGNTYPELGYTDWNTEKGFTNAWLDRLMTKIRFVDALPRTNKNIENSFKEGKIDAEKRDSMLSLNVSSMQACTNEINKITESLKRFFEGDPFFEVSSLEPGNENYSDICVITTRGEKTQFKCLPAGYKRLFYIVLDMAYRSLLLSRGESTDIPGIAIIDEIDLHLHPELEQVVLQRFMKTFTKVQFVISTHSPSVLTGLETEGKPNCILNLSSLSKTSPIVLHDVYGLDASTGLTEVMGVTPSGEELEWMISQCAFMRHKGLSRQAEEMMNDILSTYSINQERLEEMLLLYEAFERNSI